MFEEKQRNMSDSPSPVGGNSPEEGHDPVDPYLEEEVLVQPAPPHLSNLANSEEEVQGDQ